MVSDTMQIVRIAAAPVTFIRTERSAAFWASAVNQLMTLRNWAIGYYIVEYEQGGSDRAKYGARLLKNLEEQISEKGLNETLFKWCRQFYLSYPQIGTTVSHQFELPDAEKSATVSHQFVTDPERLISNLSFSHIREIMVLKDPFERFFYETECIKTCNDPLKKQLKLPFVPAKPHGADRMDDIICGRHDSLPFPEHIIHPYASFFVAFQATFRFFLNKKDCRYTVP